MACGLQPFLSITADFVVFFLMLLILYAELPFRFPLFGSVIFVQYGEWF